MLSAGPTPSGADIAAQREKKKKNEMKKKRRRRPPKKAQHTGWKSFDGSSTSRGRRERLLRARCRCFYVFFMKHTFIARAPRGAVPARPPRPPRPRPDTFVSAAVSLRPLYVYSLACGCKPHLPPAISKSYASSQCAFFTWFTGADPLVVVCGNLCAKFLCGVLRHLGRRV